MIHFYNHSSMSVLNEGDIIGLSDFIEEDLQSEISDVESICSIAKIHYHDNDIVMTESPGKGGRNITVECQWQNYAIHSYLYDRTRLHAAIKNRAGRPFSTRASAPRPAAAIPRVGGAAPITSMDRSFSKPTPTPHNTPVRGPLTKMPSATFVSITPRMYGAAHPIKPFHATSNLRARPQKRKKKAYNKRRTDAPQISKHARGESLWVQQIVKEGFLEKRIIRKSMSNIIHSRWMKYWVILWNCDLLLYRRMRKTGQDRMDQAPEIRISLDNIQLPISRKYDQSNQFFEFRLNAINNNCDNIDDQSLAHHTFRTKNEFQRDLWVSNIEMRLNNDENFDDFDLDAALYKNTRLPLKNDKTASCLVM